MADAERKGADSERKRKIREKYKGVDPSELEVIPARQVESLLNPTKILKVAAYVRVSTENDEQTSSFELQTNEFTDQINNNPMWEFAGIYSDEGISGTELSHRKGMLQMIEDARDGKIDLILTKSIARFARNIVDCLSIIDTLKALDPPVGVQFEADNIYTLDNTGRMILTILASVAEEESRSKSVIMNWSIEKRFSRGIFLTPELLGYDLDEDGDLIINPDEAETVKVIYYLFLNGYSLTEIADLLSDYGRKTKLGNTEWKPDWLRGIIENERRCGDLLCHKTFTPNFMTHKSKKNRGDLPQYRQRNHHEGIVSREVYDAANQLLATNRYASGNRPLPLLSVIDNGVLRGFVPIDKDWTGFSADDYIQASKSVSTKSEKRYKAKSKQLNLEGYQRVRAQFFSTRLDPAMTIKNGKIFFNTACLRKFEDVTSVELLLNSVNHTIAIRPCSEDNPNAIKWGRIRDGRWCTKSVSCRGLAKTLFDILEWEDDTSYRFRGQFIEKQNQKVMVFELDEPEMEKIEEIVLPPAATEETTSDSEPKDTIGNNADAVEQIVIRQKIRVFPPSWLTSFGKPVASLASVNILEQRKYAGEWDVLAPAKEIDEMNVFSEQSLNGLLEEANAIIDGWDKPEAYTSENKDGADGVLSDPINT